MGDVDEVAAEMAEAGWPGLEIHHWGKTWTAVFKRLTQYSLCTIRADGSGKSLEDALAAAKSAALSYPVEPPSA